MSISHLLIQFEKLGIKFFLVEDNQLEIEFPDGVVDDHILAEIKNRKREIVAFLSEIEHSADMGLPVTRAKEKEFYPLSATQRGIYFIQNKNPDNVAYNTPLSVTLADHIDVKLLEYAFGCLIKRHESLRTSYQVCDGQPVQRVMPVTDFRLEIIYGQIDSLSKIIASFVRPFDLSKGEMLRAALVYVEDHQRILLVDVHHIATDGFSTRIIEDDFLAFLTGVDLPPTKFQYKDFSEWQQRLLDHGLGLNQKKFWIEHLTNTPPTLALFGDHKRPSIFTFKGDVHEFVLGKEETEGLREINGRCGATLFMNMFALINVLMFRYTGQEDIVLGTVSAGRPHEDLYDIVGAFVNPLAIRNRPTRDKTYLQFLKDVKESSLSAFANQDIPFDLVLELVNVKRDSSRNNPLYDVNVVVQNYDESKNTSILSAQRQVHQYKHIACKLDLNFLIEEHGDEIYVAIEFYTGVFHKATILRLETHLRTIIRSVIKDTTTRLDNLNILSPDEKSLILEMGKGKLLPTSSTSTVVHMFGEQLQRRPQDNALFHHEKSLTYAELDELSSAIALSLRQKGVTLGNTIAVVLDRSPEMVASILAIWKIGATFVPIDPNYPSTRINFILKDAEIDLVITTYAMSHVLPQSCNYLDAYSMTSLPTGARSDVKPATKLDSIAYIIYTSGTTGTPKGVMIKHASLVNLIAWHIDEFDVSSISRATSLAGVAFDASIWEIWPYLAAGASVRLLSDTDRLSTTELLNTIRAHGITHTFLPTALISDDFLKHANSHLSDLKYLLTGGERLNGVESVPQRFFLVNNYGPTEATVVSTFHYASNEDDINVPIGRPVANTCVSVVDDNKELVPIGVKGYLMVSGEQIAAGYFNNPLLTAEKFIVTGDKQRTYLTGDLARWLPTGVLEYLGRADDQVKIRGHRVELGEIEGVLRTHSAIETCFVTTRLDKANAASIVAYVVHSSFTSTEDIFAFLRSHLPHYMVPSAIISVDHLPLTKNGKIDKQKLLELTSKNAPVHGLEQSELSGSELLVARIWTNLLGVNDSDLRTDSSFFDVGGHSLLAISMLSELRHSIGAEISVVDFFTEPTIRNVAQMIDATKKEVKSRVVTKVHSKQSKIPLSFSQERLWLIDKFQGSKDYHMPAVARLRGPLDVEALEYAFKCLISRHEVLRTVFAEEDGAVYQVLLPKNLWRLKYHRGETNSVNDIEGQIQEIISQPFDLATDHVLRVNLLQQTTEDHFLVVVLHHIASDGWSQAVLVNELMEFYQSKRENRPPDVLKLELQYSDYALWQREYLESKVLPQKITYWKSKLAGASTLNLPTDFPRPVVQDTRGDSVVFIIEETLVQKVRAISTSAGATMFMTMLAAFKILLSRYSGQKDIVVGTPVANRTQKDLEPLIGFFLNTLVIRSDLAQTDTFLHLVDQVKKSTIEAYEHQDVPFEKVVEIIQPQRQVDRNPIFQVMFNYLNQPSKQLGLNDLSIEWIDNVDTDSKFDITCYLLEDGDTITCTLDFAKSLFKKERIILMSQHYVKILDLISQSPWLPLSSLDFSSANELQDQKRQMDAFFS